MANKLMGIRSYAVGLKEMSGLATRESGGVREVLAIADRTYGLASFRLPGDDSDDILVSTFDLRLVLGKTGESQWEAVATDGEGNVFVLEESPGAVIGLASGLDHLLGRIELTVDDHELVPGWGSIENSRGEGLLLLANGHLLVAKEKGPPLLIEFGPAGDVATGVTAALLHVERFPMPSDDAAFVPLAVWSLQLTGLGDVSDLGATQQALFLLSDQSRAIVEVLLPLEPGREVVLGRSRKLPKEVAKAEGLTILGNGYAVVASDEKKKKRESLFVLQEKL